MPKGHRSMGSQSYYRLSPTSTPTSATYAPISSRPSTTSSMSNTYYIPSSTSSTLSQPTYSTTSYPTGGPVQQPPSYTSLPPAPMSTLRPSSGAWSPTDDQTLMAARAQGMNWAPIQQSYFPSKTPNACRKRHERLMERRNADDWDALKLENLARNYMTMRREIWSPLAAQTGEKWIVVEQKCMSNGLKNLQVAARSSARRDRVLDTTLSTLNPATTHHMSTSSSSGGNPYSDHHHHHPRHGDDSGIGIDDLEAEYDADGASDHSGPSTGSAGSNGLGGGGAAGGYGAYGQVHQRGGGGRGYLHHVGHGLQQGRGPSVDMGIDAIINRPGGGR